MVPRALRKARKRLDHPFLPFVRHTSLNSPNSGPKDDRGICSAARSRVCAAVEGVLLANE